MPTTIYTENLSCPFCGRIGKNKNSYAQHYIACPKNPDRKIRSISNQFIKAEQLGLPIPKYKNNSNQYIKAKQLGLPKPEISEQTRLKFSASSKKQIWTDERRKNHSETMKIAVKENPNSYNKNNVSGRVKLIEYNETSLKGNWELKTAQWLDSLNINWENETNPHDYFWNEGWHKYFPDFFLPDYNSYIEVKGYKTDRDAAKWNQFNDKLIIIDKRNINKLNEFQSIEALSELYSFN